MEHISYGLFDDVEHARAAIDAIAASGTARRHCGVVLHESHPDIADLKTAETRAGAEAREVAVLNGILGAAIGNAIVGPLGLVAGGAIGALVGAIGGAVAGSTRPDREIEKLSKQLAGGKLLVVVEAPSLASRDQADAAMLAHGAHVQHKPFF